MNCDRPTQLTTRSSFLEFASEMRALRPFRTYGALRGERSRYVSSYGVLPAEHRAKLQRAERDGTLQYVVYSYATPIAWLADDVWTVPCVPYSVTTSRHQSKIATAATRLGARAAA